MEAYDKLERLLLAKSYADLSAVEQQFVTEHMTAEEYAGQRELLQWSRTLLQEAPTLPASLEVPPRTSLSPSISLRNGLVLAIAGALLFAVAFYWGRYSSEAQDPSQQIIPAITIEYASDTVYLPQIVHEAGPVRIIEKVVRDTVYLQLPTSPIADSTQLPVANMPRQSQNARDTRSLLEATVEVY